MEETFFVFFIYAYSILISLTKELYATSYHQLEIKDILNFVYFGDGNTFVSES